jgi:ribosome-associated protein
MTNSHTPDPKANTGATNSSATNSTVVEFPNLQDEAAKQLAYAVAAAAEERKASDITILEVSDVSYLADYFVLATGYSSVQVRAITRSIQDTLEQDFNRNPLRTEGQTEGNWILLDYGEVIAHVFMPEARDYYNLEAFWGHATRLPYEPQAPQDS